MNVIYIPGGKAYEYCELALNIYNGCAHGCTYCYVPSIVRRDKEEFKIVYPRKQILTKVRSEISKYRGKHVLMSFASDPYPPIEKEYEVTRKILELFKVHKVKPVILTKSGYADRDFDLLGQTNGWYGATLTFVDGGLSKQWEPGAALPQKRMENLEKAYKEGIWTWVSLEPVIKPQQTLQLIDLTHEYVNEYKVGKLNYLREEKSIEWKSFYNQVVAKLKEYNKKYYIKKDLRIAAGV